jgi:hypothetical protein
LLNQRLAHRADHAAAAITPTSRIDVGIGVPSKYLTLPVPSEVPRP